MTYEEYVSLNILEPLELTNTGFNMTERYLMLQLLIHVKLLWLALTFINLQPR